MTRAKRPFLFGAVVGSGLTAKAADRSGADYLLALNAGRFRVQGASSLTSFLPVRPANEWVMEFSERELLGRCRTPLYAGLSVSDPALNLRSLVERVLDMGFAGVCNFPSTSSVDGRLASVFDREGLGFAREVELVQIARGVGLDTFVYVQTNQQVRQMIDVGATSICVNVGFTGGATGVATHLTLEAAAAKINSVLEGLPSDVAALCHGGPITSPEHALSLMRMCDVRGFVAGSALDRIPLEKTLDEVARSFTAIPSLTRVQRQRVRDGDHMLVGSSRCMQALREDIDQLALDDVPVLVTGETGVGKSLAALSLHRLSPHSNKPPVVVDCPAIDARDNGLHLLGRAASGRSAPPGQRGVLESAGGTSILFEEIASLPSSQQGRLLNFLDNGVVQRPGELNHRVVDTRVVSTTSMSAEDLAVNADFRLDLYFRLSGHVLRIPPLRERCEDIPELAMHLATALTEDNAPQFSNAALRVLMEYRWPGNVRELYFAMKRAIREVDGRTVTRRSVEFLCQPVADSAQVIESTDASSERDRIARALANNGFRRSQTARALGMTTRTLYNKIKRYGIQT